MQKNRAYPLILFFFLLLAFQPALGADSTSFDPTKVAVKAKGSGGVPVGTIISWPVATNPDDMDNWLECNGQSISQSVYPELFALVGPKVPDLRGLFLRGFGSQDSKHFGEVTHSSGALGDIQGDSIRENMTRGEFEAFCAGAVQRKSGVFAKSYTIYRSRDQSGWSYSPNAVLVFDMSSAGPTSNENRPVNMAVRYLMRARL
ncbi:phage tail protein [Desulfovibrio sp. G11]|nr:phage tail protein [Desulfovibrio sp. G11]ATD82359.1 hypothetical protein CNY67_13955 [Desulfovibrio sp. G11]SPD35136.1 Phage tail collar [Desulfovibrio sp. G11]